MKQKGANIFEKRKREHIRHSLDPANQAVGLTGLEQIHLNHDSMPELNLDEISLQSSFLGKGHQTPFFVAGMTAGFAGAEKINSTIASACTERGWAMGVGSLRRSVSEIEHNRKADLAAWSKFRKGFRTLRLIANLGASQLLQINRDVLTTLCEVLEPEAFAIHLNPLQECLQPEGTPRFRGVIDKIWELTGWLPVPIVLKETGCGFSAQSLEKIKDLKLAAIDVSGLGGTHWGRIEGQRSRRQSLYQEASRTFATWGEGTVDSVFAVKATLPGVEIWGSGGIRSGLDAAKLIAIGAHAVGYAQPVLTHALQGKSALLKWMEQQEFELKIALFCTGCATPAELRNRVGAYLKCDT